MTSIKRFAAVIITLLVSTNSLGQSAVDAAFQVVELPAQSGQAAKRIKVEAFGQDFLLELQPNSQVLAALPASQRTKIGSSDLFLRGRVSGVADSWVRLSRINGQYSGGFYDGQELYLIDSADALPAAIAAGAKSDQTVVFRFADSEVGDLIDHGGLAPAGHSESTSSTASYQTFIGHLQEIAVAQGSSMVAIPVTIVSDVQFTNTHGTNASSVVASRVNFVDGIYSSQLGVGIQLLHHEILSDNNVLTATDSGHLLAGEFDNGQLVQAGFRQFMASGAGSDIPFGGLAHLFTGRDLDGSTVGRAYIGVLCSRGFGYGINQNRGSNTGSALVFAHELGHNFGSPHDGENACEDETFRGIMNSRLNGSEQFSSCSIDQMSDDAGRASCLAEVGLLVDGFELN